MTKEQDNLEYSYQLSFDELCEITLVPKDLIIEIIEEGIVEPKGNSPHDWCFDIQMITTAKKAIRLHYDLDIDWPGIAIAIRLSEEIQDLQETNNALKQRINRFLE